MMPMDANVAVRWQKRDAGEYGHRCAAPF